MSLSPTERQITAAEPEIHNVPSRGIFIRYPASGENAKQTIRLEKWNTLGEKIALEIALAFIDLFSHQGRMGRSTTRGQLNKLCCFMSENEIFSLTAITDEDAEAFKRFVESVPSTRRKDWAVARQVIRHANARVGREPPSMDISPWTKKAPEWKEVTESEPINDAQQVSTSLSNTSPKALRSSRSRLASIKVARVSTADASAVAQLDPNPKVLREETSVVVVFPARGLIPAHRHSFNDWARLDHGIAAEVADATVKIKRASSQKSITTWCTSVRNLLKYLGSLDGNLRPRSIADLKDEHIAGIVDFIDKGSVARRAKVFKAIESVIKQVCRDRGRAAPRFPANPWPGHGARAPVATEPLSVSTIGAILTACSKAMLATMAESKKPAFAGVTLDALFPFAVTLAFWTLFNPETVMGIRQSEIRPDLLGRFAVVGRKGRSTKEQISTFSSSDDHPCAPKMVIDNVLTLTAPLRRRISPDKRDNLFIGMVRQQQRAKYLVQTLQEAWLSMGFHYRDAFCKEYDLPSFTVQQIRATGGVLCNRLFGGDVKIAQALMNHLSITMTDEYVRRDSKRVEAERIADQMEKRLRFVRTGGTRDVRDAPTSAQSAATPGFVCSDPFAPPRWLGQDDGMCAAYGRCPTCPLASVDRTCTISFAQVLRIRNQIHAAYDAFELDAHRWIRVWKPTLDAIEKIWLPQFSDDVRAKTSVEVYDVNVKDLPPLQEF